MARSRRLRMQISIHAAREGGDERRAKQRARVGISIHAAREGGDIHMGEWSDMWQISIHAAREGGDEDFVKYLFKRLPFQSTPPVKAATYTYI